MTTSRRLSILEVTRLCGQPIGPLRRDPSFPAIRQGSFDEAAVLGWKQARDAKAATPNPILTEVKHDQT